MTVSFAETVDVREFSRAADEPLLLMLDILRGVFDYTLEDVVGHGVQHISERKGDPPWCDAWWCSKGKAKNDVLARARYIVSMDRKIASDAFRHSGGLWMLSTAAGAAVPAERVRHFWERFWVFAVDNRALTVAEVLRRRFAVFSRRRQTIDVLTAVVLRFAYPTMQYQCMSAGDSDGPAACIEKKGLLARLNAQPEEAEALLLFLDRHLLFAYS